MATAAAALPGTFNFQGLPGELRNAIFLQAHRDRRNYVMHHYFLVQRDVTVGRSLRRYYSMPRCYVCVNPFGRSINDNTPVTRHAPIFRGIPGSNVDGHFLSWRKIELPRGAHFKRATMTYATRNVRAQFAASEHRPPGEKYIYVDWFQDVFVFHNVYGYPPYSAPPADVSSDRQNQFQFLSDNLSRGVNQNVGYTAGGGHLNWVTNVRKAGVIIHDHFYPVTPAPLRDGYTQWILTIVNNVIDRFQSLQRLYLIIDAWDPACALLAGDRRDLDTGRRQTLDSDGFVDYFRFLRSHRSAIHHSGYVCQCQIPIHAPPPAHFNPYLYDSMQDAVLRNNLETAVTRSGVKTSPHLASQSQNTVVCLLWIVINCWGCRRQGYFQSRTLGLPKVILSRSLVE